MFENYGDNVSKIRIYVWKAAFLADRLLLHCGLAESAMLLADRTMI